MTHPLSAKGIKENLEALEKFDLRPLDNIELIYFETRKELPLKQDNGILIQELRMKYDSKYKLEQISAKKEANIASKSLNSLNLEPAEFIYDIETKSIKILKDKVYELEKNLEYFIKYSQQLKQQNEWLRKSKK